MLTHDRNTFISSPHSGPMVRMATKSIRRVGASEPYGLEPKLNPAGITQLRPRQNSTEAAGSSSPAFHKIQFSLPETGSFGVIQHYEWTGAHVRGG